MFILTLVSVALGAVLGALSRHLIYIMVSEVTASYWATCLVNMIGSFLIGGVFYFFSQSDHPYLQVFLMAGLLGSLTTFSTFSLDAVRMILNGQIIGAMSYLILQTIIGVSFCFFGVKIAQYLYR